MWSTSAAGIGGKVAKAAVVVGKKIIERKLSSGNSQPVAYSTETSNFGAPSTGIGHPISAPVASINGPITGFNYGKTAKVAKVAAVVGGKVLERQINKQNEKTEKLTKIASIASKVPQYLGK